MDLNEKKSIEIRPVLVKLLQGFINHDHKKLWEMLIIHQDYVRNYFKALGLYMHLNRNDGYAFLKTTPEENIRNLDDINESELNTDDESEESTSVVFNTSLIRKIPLSFDLSLLLVLLREALEHYDEKVSDDYRLILKNTDIYEQLKTFYQSSNSGGDETKLFKKFDTLIAKVVSMGFLKELKVNSGTFEVRRSIKAFMNADQLKEMKQKMHQYVEMQNA